MTRRVGFLQLAILLTGALSPGCITPGGDKTATADEGPRRGDGASRVVARADRPSLPRDWKLREPPPADQGIQRVTYPDDPLEPTPPRRGPAPQATVEVQAAPRKAPPDEPPPEALDPAFEIKAKPEEPLVAALRCYLDKRPAEAVEHLKACDRADQEALLCLLPLAVRLSEGSLERARPDEMAAMVDGLRGVETSLEKRAALRIEKMCFCRQARAFGDYEPIPDGQAAFESGSGGQAGELIQVYAEVRNFASAAQGPFQVIRLTGHAEIRDYAHGKTVKRIDFDPCCDRCRSPRQDYFIRSTFRVPADLPPGPYVLWIFVEDALAQPARPAAQRSLDFRVVAGGSPHGSRGESGGVASR
jgi:hypothetical protein